MIVKDNKKINPIISDKEAKSIKVQLQTTDGKDLGEVSAGAYSAIRGGYLDKYSPISEEEKSVIDAVKKELIFPFVIEAENEKKDFGKISYEALKAIQNGNIENYKPINDIERKSIDDYKKYISAFTPKTESEQQSGRDATFKDITINSFKRGYVQSLYGQETYKELTGQKNNKKYYEEKLKNEDYSFIPDGWFEKMVSGGMELLGQQVKQWTDPRSLTFATTAAGTAAIAGQAGPQVLAPEEIVTVPTAFLAGIAAGSATSNFEIEAGHAYNEMIEQGISPTTAKKIALGVGAGNAALEALQVDDLIKSAKILTKTNADSTITKKLLSYLTKRGIHIATETLQEVGQEGVTISGVNIGSKIDKGEWAYDTKDVISRLGDTAASSALSFAFMGGSGDFVNYGINKTGDAMTNASEKKEKAIIIGKIMREDNSVQAIIDTGLESPKDSTAYKLAEKAQQKLNKKGELSDYEVGRLYFANVAQIESEEQTTRETTKAEETPTTEENSVTETSTVAENTTVEQTTPVATEQRNTFTEELDEIASTEMPTVNVGETFVESGTGKTIRVVSRDDAATTVEITLDGKTETKTLPNKTADTLSVDDKYTKVEPTAETDTQDVDAKENATTNETEDSTTKTITLTQVGKSYQAFGEDARVICEQLGLDPQKAVINGVETDTITFPTNFLDGIVEELGEEYNFITNESTTSTTEAENTPATDESTQKEQKKKIIRAKKSDWVSHDIYWYAPNSKIIIAYSTRSASDLIETMSEDNPKMTISELHDAINYDEEAKKVLQAYINSGFGEYSASEYFTDNNGENIDTETAETDTKPIETKTSETVSKTEKVDETDIIADTKETETSTEIVTEETLQPDVVLTDKCTLTATKRTDNGKDIWVVSLNDRISTEEFNELRKIVKEYGGSYSRFAKSPDGKSIPGFIFNSEPTAEAKQAFNDFFGDTEVQETKAVNDAKTTGEVLQNQSESDIIEEKVDKESVDNGDEKYDLSGENIGKDAGEKRGFREGDSEGNTASSTDSKGKSGKIRTPDSGENDNKILGYEKGVVKKVYHGSVYQFKHFEKSYVDVGIHFGSKEQAIHRAGKDGILKEYDLRLENPLECKDVFGERTPDKYVYDIIENSKLSENEKAELKERYIDYCNDTVSLDAVKSLESKIASGKYQIDMNVDKDGVFVSVSLIDDLGKVNHIPMAELINVDVLKDVFGEKNTELLLQSGEVSELAKSKLSSAALEFAANIEMNFLKLRKIEDILSSFGYDGFAYRNENEGDGWSYAVFDDSQIIKKTINEDGAKNDESQSEVLAGESGNDDRGLHSGTTGPAEQETTERVDGQHRENSGEGLSQSTSTDGNRPDVGNDSEGVHGRNDADNVESETTGNATELAENKPETIETEDKAIEKKRPSNKGNFVITDDIAREFDNTPPSAEDNIKAIELLLTLENEGRPATAEEKKILAKYKGWGGIDTRRLPWELSRKLYELYNGEQLREMQSSQNNAFFTPTGVIDAMYNGLKRMGFKGGNVLESSMGVGNFFGRMPAAMTGKSALTGVELESYTARIAQYLYPGATVINKPFQDVAIRNGSYDLVIGNVPFGQNKISYNKKKYSLHNYFIISSLDKVKDGGIVAVITSSGTLDSYSVDARSAIMDRADVVACYKLPAGVFSRNASTDVQTDLLILRKRGSNEKPSGDSILNVTTTADGLRLNEYFVKHPENILGTLAKGTNAWGEITTVLDNGNFYDKLNDAMKKLPKDLISGKVELKPIETIVSTSSKPRFFEKNGKIYADDGAGTATTVPQSQENTVRDYMAVRDAYKDLLAAYDSDMSEADIKPLRDKLTKVYDNFCKKHDAITGDGKKKIGNKKSKINTFLEADSDYYLVSGLERYNSNEKRFEKSALFEKDTLRKKKVTSVDAASDALAVSLNESGKVDFARMSELTGKTEKQLVEELKGEIVLTPEGDYVLTDIYLSGNIYEKLEAVKDKPEFNEQKEMLEKVLPTPKDASSITIKLGANYIDSKYIEDFSREVFHERISVSKNSSGAWSIDGVRQTRWGDILNVKYGCDKFNAIQLLEKVLNDSEIIANKKVKVDGKSVDVFDEKMTEVARQKAEDIKEAFESWIFRDSERRTDVVNKYNRTYNNYRPLDYEHIAEKLSFDSMDETLKAKLYPHQKKGIARFLFGGNILFAHGVGTGKTFEMIASVMEAKRMGIVNKTAMVVPNNKVVDFKNDIAKAYPDAKVLVIDTANKKRQTMLGLVNSNDWDIVLIARTTFTKIPVGAELQSNYINQQLEDLDHQIMEAEHDRNITKRKLKGLYTQRDNLAQKLKDLDSDTKRDENSIEFEKLGFDCICVDEAHNYKSITTTTKLDIKGLVSGGNAQQANDMLMKLDYMRSIDGRIIFGTGTPITNTVSEIYNMMRMVRPDILEDAGIRSLDEWVNTFAKIESHTEIGIDNKIKNKSTQTIRSFVNATDMVGMFRQFADVIFTKDVVKNLPKAKYIDIEIDGTDEHRQIESEISSAIASASGTDTLKVYTKVMAMANAASIDLKMLSGADSDVNIYKDYSLEELEYENSKINTMCNYVYDEYKASNNIKGTQIIFCDGGAGSGEIYSFNVHNDIVKKLVERGIPEKEIVIVKNQKDAQLEELFDKVNSGEVRVLIGTSRKMAEGLNVQKRVVAIHHPTVTFKPSDKEQGDARGVRAGNINEEVRIYRYLQGNTFDSYKWQAIDRKGEMINAALRGEAIDELEDIGADDDSGAGVDAATAMAITSGNPLVKEKIDIDKEVKRLKTLKQNFMNEYYRYQDAVAKNPGQIRQLTEFAQRLEQDIALRNKFGDKASISIKGKTFEKQSDANKALVEAVKSAPKNGQFTKLGEYNGFDIMFKGDTGGMNYSLVLKGANEYSVEYAGNGNNIARIAGVLNRLDAELSRAQKKVEQLKADLEFAKQEVDKPFDKENDLTEALEKQKDITYRYEHFGESQNTERSETEGNENTETVRYSKQSVDNTSEEENRWVTGRVNTVNDSKKSKEKLVSIADIVNSIREKFDIPIATGKVTNPEAAGLYKEKAESIRTRIANNLPTISHELGHHIDKKYKISELDSVKNLRKAVSEEFLNQYSDDEKNGEAVSEFVRQYLKNKNDAYRLCPEFYEDFVRALSKEDLQSVNEIANAVNEYMSYDFSGRVRASIVSGSVKEKTSLSEKAKQMHTDWIDGFLPIKDVVEYVEETTGNSLTGRANAYTLATNSLNARAIANFNTVHGFRDLNGNIIKGAKSFIECIANVDKKELNTLDEYLVLKHSLEWIAPKNPDVSAKRVFADDTLEDVESIEKRIAVIETNYPEMKKAAENLYEYQRNILKYIVVPVGGMTEDTFNSLNEKYPCYVPFYRAIGKDGAKTKGSFANQKSPIKRAKGSGELILSPLESIIKNTDKMVKFALRNQTMQVLTSYADTVDGFGKFIEKVPPDMLPHTTDITFLKGKFEDALQQAVSSGEDYFAVSDLFDDIFGNAVTDFTPIANANKKIVTVLRGGAFSYYQVHDDALYDAIAEFTPRQLKGIFALSHKIMQPMKMLITQANPVFGTTNLIRDIGTAYKHSPINNPLEFAKRYVVALKEVVTKGDMYKQWQAMGGGHNSELSANLDQIKVTLRQVAQKDIGKARRLLYSIVCHPVASIAAINDYIESVPRTMEFMRTLESGGDLQQAIYNADDITTNFKRSGKGSLAKDINSLVMFNNAALQGLNKTYRTLTNKNQSERTKSILKWVLSALFMAAIQSVWNNLDDDDDDYKNLSSYKKNNFYNFAIGDGKFISIPKARETALIDSFTERTIEYVFGNDEAFYGFGSYLFEQIFPPMLPGTINPIDAAHDVLGSTVVGGIADIGWNKNYMDVPIEGAYDNYSPSNERYTENTTKAAYALGQTKIARMADMSPKKIDHLISSYTGIIGQVNKALFPMNKENRDVTIGLRNKFISDSNYSTDLLNKAYDNRDKSKLQWQYDDNINNAIEYEQNAVITSYISGMNKAIKALPGDEQREGRKYLLKTLNNWDYETTTQQFNMINRLEGESISEDYIFEEVPSSKLEWTKDKQKYTYQMTPQEYNKYISDYLKAIEAARKQYGGNSSEGYSKAKEAAKDYMSKYKDGLKSKYQSKATKVE